MENLGIEMNWEGIKTPIYGKPKQKRGQKSLKELREVARQVKEQTKIIKILQGGKGKNLFKEQ